MIQDSLDDGAAVLDDCLHVNHLCSGLLIGQNHSGWTVIGPDLVTHDMGRLGDGRGVNIQSLNSTSEMRDR